MSATAGDDDVMPSAIGRRAAAVVVGRNDAMSAKGLLCPRYAQKRTSGLAFSPSALWAPEADVSHATLYSRLVVTSPKPAQKRPQTSLRPFVVRTSASCLAITSDNDTRDSTEGHSTRMRGGQRAGTGDHNRREHSNSIYIRRSMRERSRSRSTLGRTRRNTQGHSRHSSRNLGHRRRRWRLCHQSPPLQLVRPRVRDPSHHLATPELVTGPPRQRHRWWQRSLTPILLFSCPKPFQFPELQPAGPAIVSRERRLRVSRLRDACIVRLT
jgi:hypothetical protein